MENKSMHSRTKITADALLDPVLLVSAAGAWADLVDRSRINLSPGVICWGTIYDLHMLSIWICTAIGIGVFAVMFYSIIAPQITGAPNPSIGMSIWALSWRG